MEKDVHIKMLKELREQAQSLSGDLDNLTPLSWEELPEEDADISELAEAITLDLLSTARVDSLIEAIDEQLGYLEMDDDDD